MEKINNCSRCGSDQVYLFQNGKSKKWAVYCLRCLMRSKEDLDKEKCIREWNEREE